MALPLPARHEETRASLRGWIVPVVRNQIVQAGCGTVRSCRESLSVQGSNTLQMRWLNSIRALPLSFEVSPSRAIFCVGAR
jgi:hypothetical protein